MHIEEIARLQAFFLKAAGQCYAGGLPKSVDPITGERSYSFNDNRGRVYHDRYYSVGNGYSFGQTIIFGHGIPVWQKHYQGWCQDGDDRIIPLLKAALRKNYCEGVWNAGRGPLKFEDKRWPGLVYQNGGFAMGGGSPRSFDNFSTREVILRLKDDPSLEPERVFWHEVHGLLLASVK